MAEMTIAAVLGLLGAAGGGPGEPAFRAPQATSDYAAAMRRVATRFAGTPGVYLQIGDSLTYASSNTAWARDGLDHTPAEAAFLRWSHAGRRDQRDGWHLASVDVADDGVPPGRSHPAASGLRSDELLAGGKAGLSPLAEMLEHYRPQLALYLLGTNDLLAGRPAERYVADVERAAELMLARGTVPILSTLPPCRGHADRVDADNTAVRALARRLRLPLIDLHAEMRARAGEEMERVYLAEDGVHLTHEPARGPVTAANLARCGYLLRCYLAVHKGMEVKAAVLDPNPPGRP